MTARAKKATAAGPDPAPAAPPVELPMPGGGRGHPPFGVGLWALGRWTRDDETRTKATIEHALHRNVPWFDTAEVYGTGRSERLLGDALAKAAPPAPGPFLSTKVSWEHLRPAQVRSSLQGSLQRLGRPRVDVYLVHAPDARVPIRETMGALGSLHAEGRIGAVGVSNFGPEELRAAADALPGVPLAVDQIRYSLLEPDEGDALRDLAKELGIVVEAYTPLARGLLAGRYLDGELPSETVRSIARDLFDRDQFKPMRERAKALRRLAEKEGVPMASLALHWLARQGAAPIVGTSRPEQVDELLAAWAVKPGDAALDRAEKIGRGRAAA